MTSRFAAIERASSGEDRGVARRELVTTGDPCGEGTFVGHYRVHGTLGRGAYGDVFEVSHRSSPTTRRALKILRPHFSGDRTRWSTKHIQRFEQQFAREGELQMNVFKHANILRVLDVGVTVDGAPYLVSDLLEGQTLDQVLRAARNVGQADPWARPTLCQPANVWRISRDICDALDAVHRRGFVHRDIKPSNLMLSSPKEDWVAVLTDFGIAVRAGVCDPADWGIGTPRYMAPEIVSSGIPAAASRLVTTASDVYSFALVIYELLTLAHPYAERVKELLNGRDRTVVDTAERRRDLKEAYRLAQRSSNPTPPRAYAPWLPRSVEQALLRALSRDPAARPRILDLFAELAELRDLGGGYDTVPLDWSSLEDVDDDVLTDASGDIKFANWIDGERAASRAASPADAKSTAVRMADTDRRSPKVSDRSRRQVTCAPTLDERLERAVRNGRAAALAGAFVVMAVGIGWARTFLPAHTSPPAADNESSAPVMQPVSPPQWLLDEPTNGHSAPPAAPPTPVARAANPHPSHAAPAHSAAHERARRSGGDQGASAPTRPDGILVQVQGFESVIDPLHPLGASETSNDDRMVRAHLIPEPGGTLGTEGTCSVSPAAAAGSATTRAP